MDKLKPILEHKFWILLFLALVLPTIGWFMATGTYAQTSEERKTKIESAFSSTSFGPNVPNGKWVENAQREATAEKTRLDAAHKFLAESQKKEMDWPANVAPLVQDVPYEEKFSSRALEAYRIGYGRQLDKIEKILKPYDPRTNEGLILYSRPSVSHLVPEGTWASQPPLSMEMWHAQEDLWLTRAIFQAIARLNEGSDKLSDAPIRQLLELTLRGGDRDYTAGGGAAGGGAGMAGGSMEEMAGSDMYAMGSGGGEAFGGQRGGGPGVKVPEARFDLSDELGPSGGGRGMGMGGGSSMGMTMSSADMASSASSSGGGGAGSAPAGPSRYVDDEENLPFRTRAFVLGVVMDHRRINDFLAEISGSPWPIQVIRVQHRMLNPDQLQDAGRGGRGPGGGGYGAPPVGGGFGAATPGGFNTSSFAPGGGFEAEMAGGAEAGMNSAAFGAPSTGGGFGTPGAGMAGLGGMGGGGMMTSAAAGAMKDPYLAEVWIGGLITMFKPVEADAAQDGTAADTGAATAESAPLSETLTDEAPAAADDPVPAAEDEAPAADGTTVPGTPAESVPETDDAPADPPEAGTAVPDETPAAPAAQP